MRKKSRGFTFIEIMFVVVIIGVLSTVVAANVGKKMDTGKRNAALTQLNVLAQAIEQFQMDTGSYPSTQTGLKALVNRPAGVTEAQWNGPYLKSFKLPLDPWGHEYRYREPGEDTPDFDVWSVGKDGVDGTSDDVTRS